MTGALEITTSSYDLSLEMKITLENIYTFTIYFIKYKLNSSTAGHDI